MADQENQAPHLDVTGTFFKLATDKGDIYGIVVEEPYFGTSHSEVPLIRCFNPESGKPEGDRIPYYREIDGNDVTIVDEKDMPFDVDLNGTSLG
jgi:hypothetical protein